MISWNKVTLKDSSGGLGINDSKNMNTMGA